MGLFLAAMELLISMLSVAIIAAGGWLIMRDQLDYRDLITFSLYVTTFINPIRKLANSPSCLPTALPDCTGLPS